MKKSLKQIREPIKKEILQFEKHFKASMKSKVPLLDRITYYIVQRKGKQVRPMFVFLSAKSLGSITESSYIAASLIEILHTATLVHDDVVDDAYKRRGFFSINALWKNKIAVLVGDYLLSKGLLLALDHNEIEVLRIISDAVRQMSEGELLQIEKARRLDIEEEIYFDIIKKKTASLIAAACSAGAYTANRNKEECALFRDFGEYLGISFQIKDDLFDYGGDNTDKPKGIDIKEKKLTLPLIHVLKNSSPSDKKWMLNIVKRHNKDKEKVKSLIRFVGENGGMDYAREIMHQYKEKALTCIAPIPDSASKRSLIELVNFVVERNK